MTVIGMSGVAGNVGTEITPEVAVSVGRAIGSRYKNVVISRDADDCGMMIADAVAAGICSMGSDVVDIGICPLPTSVRCIAKEGCGISVTAPMGSANYRWIRFTDHDGSSFTAGQMDEIRGIINDGVKAPYVKHDSVGIVSMEDIPAAAHMKDVIDRIEGLDCPVIIDCASDSTSLVTPLLFAEMGADVITMNSVIGKGLTGRYSVESNMRDLIKHVRSVPGSIGIAHDSSGSRVAAIDESGRLLSGDVLTTLLASHLMVESIAVPMNATMAIDEIVKGKVIRTMTGDDHIADAMKKNMLPFGGEPSGTFIFADPSFCPDGIYAAALIAKIASDGSLRQAVDELPRYPSGSTDIKFIGDREDILKRLGDRMSSADCDALTAADGWRAELSDGWYYIRMSNFENRVRITAEARDKVYMNCLLDIAEDLVSSCIR
jgi:phosphoglucosamine mutase